MHPKLRTHPNDLGRLGAFAIQRERHISPTTAAVDHDGLKESATIEWIRQDAAFFRQIDSHRITEDGAEAVALAYFHSRSGWIVKRRLQRGENADWLLQRDAERLAIEVSGTRKGDPFTRLAVKKRQIGDCLLAAERLAIVVAFGGPSIVVGKI